MSPGFLYRQHYRLAASDPRFLALDQDEILTDLWAIYYYTNPQAAEDEDSGDPDFEETLRDLGLESPDAWEDA